MPPAPVATRLCELITQATPADVSLLDEQIAAAETSLASLKTTRKILAAAVGEPMGQADALAAPRPAAAVPAPAKKPIGRPRKNPLTAPAAAADDDEPLAAALPKEGDKAPPDLNKRRVICLKYIRKNKPEMFHLNALSGATGIARKGHMALGAVLDHEWFHTNPDGMVTVTDKGYRTSIS